MERKDLVTQFEDSMTSLLRILGNCEEFPTDVLGVVNNICILAMYDFF